MHRKYTEAQFKHLIHAILLLCLSTGVIQVDSQDDKEQKQLQEYEGNT